MSWHELSEHLGSYAMKLSRRGAFEQLQASLLVVSAGPQRCILFQTLCALLLQAPADPDTAAVDGKLGPGDAAAAEHLGLVGRGQQLHCHQAQRRLESGLHATHVICRIAGSSEQSLALALHGAMRHAVIKSCLLSTELSHVRWNCDMR